MKQNANEGLMIRKCLLAMKTDDASDPGADAKTMFLRCC